MKDIKPEKMWAIWNKDFGFYVGTRFNRKAMIAEHTNDIRKSWEDCKKDGDRAVRVLISPIEKAKA